ncbi:retropepsin-like aspartic protease [Culturomica massiliensis]|uniref:retropepsin-like aspartic protease n=1 Tax=Culturomica massiliensis TaxID=1841857 RepID=UPI0026707EB9|nr:retropepsin-like aspartic protease [Culturomica massiliensis]
MTFLFDSFLYWIKILAVLFSLTLSLFARGSEPFDTIPFEISPGGKIYIDVCINQDTVPLRFMLDTGSSDNVVNTRSERALKALRGGVKEALTVGATGESQTRVTDFDQSLFLDSTEFSGVRFVLIPLDEEIDGIVGWNTLTGADFFIDFDSQNIFLYSSGELEIKDETLWRPIQFMPNGLAAVELDFVWCGQKKQEWFFLDSGSDRVMDFFTPYLESNKMVTDQKSWGKSRIAGLEPGKGVINEVMVDELAIGPYTLFQIPAGLNLSASGIAATDYTAGTLGNNLMQRFNQAWSFVNRKVAFIPNRRLYSTPYAVTQALGANRVTLRSSGNQK